MGSLGSEYEGVDWRGDDHLLHILRFEYAYAYDKDSVLTEVRF